MKFFNSRFINLAIGATFALTMFACKGPEGPTGPAGPAGVAGDAVKCQKCHTDTDADINLKFGQYGLSKHAEGVVYAEEAGRAACNGCHTGDGFRVMVANNVDTSSVGSSPINCKTCHTIHKKYDSTDWGVTKTSSVKLRVGGATVDFKNGNLCATCHQGRVYSWTTPTSSFEIIANGPDTSYKFKGSASYNRYGPHYGVAANIFSQNGPVAISGSETYPASNTAHGALSKGCVSCHMSEHQWVSKNTGVGGHTFKYNTAPKASECACHTLSATNGQVATTLRTDLAAKIKAFRADLIIKGWLDTTQAVTPEGYITLGEYVKNGITITKVQAQALVNYLYVAKDRSNGAHNPAYMKALIVNSHNAIK